MWRLDRSWLCSGFALTPESLRDGLPHCARATLGRPCSFGPSPGTPSPPAPLPRVPGRGERVFWFATAVDLTAVGVLRAVDKTSNDVDWAVAGSTKGWRLSKALHLASPHGERRSFIGELRIMKSAKN